MRQNGFSQRVSLLFLLSVMTGSLSGAISETKENFNDISSISKGYRELLENYSKVPQNKRFNKENEAIFSEFRNYFSNLYDYGPAYATTFQKDHGFDFETRSGVKIMANKNGDDGSYTPRKDSF